MPEPATLRTVLEGVKWNEDRANVFRESKVVILLTSTLERCCLERTKTQFSCDEYHMRCYGLLKDPVGRAICECFLAIGSLEGCVKPSYFVQCPSKPLHESVYPASSTRLPGLSFQSASSHIFLNITQPTARSQELR